MGNFIRNYILYESKFSFEEQDVAGKKIALYLMTWKELLFQLYDANVALSTQSKFTKYKKELLDIYLNHLGDTSDYFFDSLKQSLKTFFLRLKTVEGLEEGEGKMNIITKLPFILTSLLSMGGAMLVIVTNFKKIKLSINSSRLYSILIKSYLRAKLGDILKKIITNQYSSKSSMEKDFYKLIDDIYGQYPTFKSHLVKV